VTAGRGLFLTRVDPAAVCTSASGAEKKDPAVWRKEERMWKVLRLTEEVGVVDPEDILIVGLSRVVNLTRCFSVRNFIGRDSNTYCRL